LEFSVEITSAVEDEDAAGEGVVILLGKVLFSENN